MFITQQRHREIEALACSMFVQSPFYVTPFGLANRARISWFLARDILRGLVRKGEAKALRNGHFGRPKRTN